MGIAAGELIGPLIRVVNPNIVDLYAHDDACFHNLLAVALKERHPKEVLKTALNLLGTGQLSLTKVAVMLREDVDPRDFRAMLRELWYRFEPEERMLIIPDRAARYPGLHLLPAARREQGGLRCHRRGGDQRAATRPRWPTRPGQDRRVVAHRLLDGGFLVVEGPAGAPGGARER